MLPIRSCIACRKRENWSDLLRLVVIENQVHPDPNRKLPGRGGWMHRKCFDVAVQRNAFNRAFGRNSKSSQDLNILDLQVLENYLETK